MSLRRKLAPLALAFMAAAAPLPAVAHHEPEHLADVIETIMPAVVNVSIVQQDDQPGAGSGFVIDGVNGYIVTNNHVIEGAKEITVSFYNQEELPATLVGADPVLDIAVLKVQSDTPLPAATIGDSAALRLGNTVIAIGNPMGFSGTVTTGIVSALNRDLGAGPYDQFIQTDAAINRGNSGGPLFNYDGKIVGINTAIISPNGGSVGIGFAIPYNLAEWSVQQIINTGSVQRGWLGVSMATLSKDDAKKAGIGTRTGVLVNQALPGTPAATAGLQQGDIVLNINGTDIKSPREMTRIVGQITAGTTVDVVYWRDGAEHTASVTLALRPAPEQPGTEPDARREELPEMPPGIIIPMPRLPAPGP